MDRTLSRPTARSLQHHVPAHAKPQGLIAQFLEHRLNAEKGSTADRRTVPGKHWDLLPPSYASRSGDEIPDSVIHSFRESLDAPELNFLKRGPRSWPEELAFSQRVHPKSHRTAEEAPIEEQRELRSSGSFDQSSYFLGPDLKLYKRRPEDTEPLAQRLRRGLEQAIGGIDRPLLGDLVGAAFAPPGLRGKGPGGERFIQARYGALDPEPPPLPPKVPEVRNIADKFMTIAGDVASQGLDVGAGAMRHFIHGEGRPVEYDYRMFRSFPVVQEAEGGAQKHIVDWMLATHPKKRVAAGRGYVDVDRGLEEIKSDLLSMNDGDTLHRGSHWDTQFPYSKPRFFVQAVGLRSLSRDANLFGMTGDAMLRSDAGLTFHRRGNRIDFKGNVEHNFDESFAFELDGRGAFYAPASGSSIPWEFSQEQGVALQNARIGKPFRTYSHWTKPVSGSLVIDDSGGLKLDQINWGSAEPRRKWSDVP
ncbi:MAG: hypothetical protein ACKVP5_17275 [Aestuariivirga sp.]